MKHVKLFENWMEDEDNDQTAYVDTPVAQASMDMGDEEMDSEIDDFDEDTPPDDRNPEMDDYDEDVYADGIGYDDTKVDEEEMENEEE
jgi:hypothetical protein